MSFILNIFQEIVFFFNEVSIYLLFGFTIAGLLHVIFPQSLIRRHLGKSTLGSVIKSTVFGIPLPLCSCGVVPVAASLRNSGASRGATISFLISTPQVGADSFMITYSLLGWVFAIFRIVASLVTAMTAGIMVNALTGANGREPLHGPGHAVPRESTLNRLKNLFSYIEYNILGSIANSLVVGFIIAGTIAAVIPDNFFAEYLGNNLASMFIMLVIGIPMYICATASTPIAASLVMKGISPGAALVFLLTGPATNAITISTVVKTLGKKSAMVYLSAIAVVALILGYLLNVFTAEFGFNKVIMLHEHEMLPEWLKIGGSAVLASMISWYYIKIRLLNRIKEKKKMSENTVTLNVEGMTCMHCAGTVQKAVESVQGTSGVNVDLAGKKVEFELAKPENLAQVKTAIKNAGYTV